MNKYLYAASVQGIQSFIFQSNKLKEIVGASTIVDDLCKDFFNSHYLDDIGEENIILQAAGNIKCIVDSETCKKIVREFPMLVVNKAPGITISQAVVKLAASYPNNQEMNEVEKRLRIQRNRPAMPLDTGYMGLERARRTGGVAVASIGGELLDLETLKKVETREEDTIKLFKKFSGIERLNAKQVPFDFKYIPGTESESSWIAIIHADGNSIGKLVQGLTAKEFRGFSKKLGEATKEAARDAFQQVIPEPGAHQKYPIRPVILGGDDLTVIIRADLALKFTEAYLKAFESRTQEYLSKFLKNKEKLTACAGIAYIKVNYPFHYGAQLADKLTNEAKKASKDIDKENPPSSLAIYKVLSSFVEPLDEMKKRTHFVAGKLYFDHGPYFVHPVNGRPTVDDIFEKMNKIKESDDLQGVGKLRHWLTLLHKNPKEADIYLDRMKQVNKDFYMKMDMDRERKTDSTTIIFDLIQLYSFEPKELNWKV